MSREKGIVSPDDHVVEPPDVWTNRLPAKYLDVGPRVRRERGRMELIDGTYEYLPDPEGKPVDVWQYEDVTVATSMTAAAVGYSLDDVDVEVMTFEQMRPGCYQQKPRLEDMDIAGIEASVCFPNLFVRFCGQRFLHGKDKDLSLLCVQAYNDFMVDEWCAGSDGRLIPLGILPLWDIDLVVAEVERMAAKGMHAMCFSEIPPFLGLPSIHGNYWDPLFAACQATRTVLLMHIGSSSKMPLTSLDAPPAVYSTLPAINSAMSTVDWIFSGVLCRFPELKIGMSETQAGWAPYFLQRADEVWERHRGWSGVEDKILEPPSTYFPGRIFLSIFGDAVSLRHLDLLGDNLMYETDYPHNDSRWPDCLKVAQKELEHLDDVAAEKILRGNAMHLLGLD
jgi:predicted TIM-barrel fold metal-dependent hydrolase